MSILFGETEVLSHCFLHILEYPSCNATPPVNAPGNAYGNAHRNAHGNAIGNASL